MEERNHQKREIQTHSMWKQAWCALADNLLPMSAVLGLFIIIPQVVSEWFLTTTFSAQLEVLQNLKGSGNLQLMDFLQSLSSGLMFMIFILGLNLLTFTMAYIIITNMVLQHLRSQPRTPLKEYLKPTLRKLLKCSFLLFLIAALYVMIQATLPPLILLTAPVIMAPILYISESRGLWASISDSLTLKYLKHLQLPKIAVYFTLLGYIGFLILAVYLAVWVGDIILNFDLVFPIGFDFVNESFLGLPFSFAQVIFEATFVTIFSYAMVFFIALKVCFFFFTTQINRTLPDQGVEA